MNIGKLLGIIGIILMLTFLLVAARNIFSNSNVNAANILENDNVNNDE